MVQIYRKTSRKCITVDLKHPVGAVHELEPSKMDVPGLIARLIRKGRVAQDTCPFEERRYNNINIET